MNTQNIKEILQIILDNLQGKNFTWWLEGSANLLIQGVDVSVRDLDITTNESGIEIFREALSEHIREDYYSEKIQGRTIICDIGGAEVEINAYGDRELDMFEKTEPVEWEGLEVPILPLEHAKLFYERIDRKKKVELISRHL